MRAAVVLWVHFKVKNRRPGRSVLGVRSFLSLERVRWDVVSSLGATAGLLGGFSQSQRQLAGSTRQGRVRRENRY